MKTLNSPSTMFKPLWTQSTSAKPLEQHLLMHALPTTATAASPLIAYAESSVSYKSFIRTIKRTRYVIKHDQTGQYLATVNAAQPVWVDDPRRALQHCEAERAIHNVQSLRSVYGIQDHVNLQEVSFFAYAAQPLNWFVDYV
jgi:hypothetical protein